MFLKDPNLIFQELYVSKILSSSRSVDLANNKKILYLVRQQICLLVELTPHKKFSEFPRFLRNAPEGSTVTHPGGLALIYVARGRFFDSQSKAESPNKENFEGGLEYSLHSPHNHTLGICRIVCT